MYHRPAEPMWQQRASPTLLTSGSGSQSNRTLGSGRPGSGGSTTASIETELRRTLKRLVKRVEVLEGESQALRESLEVAGLLDQRSFEISVHRQNFARVRRAHPCPMEATMTDLLVTKELMANVAQLTGKASLQNLGTCCRHFHHAAQIGMVAVRSTMPMGLYVCGGRDGQRCLNSVEVLDPRAGEWNLLPVMNSHRAAGVAAQLNGKLYVCGGWSGATYLNTVEVYDPILRSWSQAPSMTQKAAAAAAQVLDGRLYVCGGWDGAEALKCVERYDPHADYWESVEPMIQQRHGAAAVRAAEHLYICGGHDNMQALSSVERFDPDTASWQMLPNMAEPRHGATAARVHGEIFVCGGHNGESALSTAECLDLHVMQWRSLSRMAQGREGAGAVALDGLVYVCGGLDGRRRAVQTTECYIPAYGRWEYSATMETRRAFVAAAVSPV